MKIGILNSGGYNINSIRFALNRLSCYHVSIVTNENEFNECDKIIIPGVGHAKNAMNLLHKQDLINAIKSTKKPVLGICLGIQIMFNFSEEGNTKCLGIFDENVIRLINNIQAPQMGWNKLINGKNADKFVYFANSYYVPICKYTESYVDYNGIKMSAMVKKNNFFGCQFHPEKSGKIGEEILKNFLFVEN